MKNSPEKNEFRELENRLRNYSEQPDADLWGKIQTGMGQGDRVAGAPWKIRTAIGVAVLLLSLGIYFGYQQWNDSSSGKNTKNEQQANADKSAANQHAGIEKNDSAKGLDNATENKSTQPLQSSTTHQDDTGNSPAEKVTQQPSLMVEGRSAAGQSISGKTKQQARPQAIVNRKTASANAGVTTSTKANENKFSSKNKDKSIENSPAFRGIQTDDEAARSNGAQTAGLSSALKDNPVVNEPLDAVDDNSTQSSKTVKVEQTSEFQNTVENKSANTSEVDAAETSSNAIASKSDLKSSTPISDSTLEAKPKEVKKQVRNKSVVSKPRKLPQHKTITIYGSLTPSLSFLAVTPHANDNVSVREFQNPSIVSTDRIGLSFDAGIQGEINSRLSYIAGVSFYHQAQTLHYKEIKAGSNFVTGDYNDFNYAINPSTVDQSMRYTMTNAGLQAGLLYTLKNNAHLTHRIGLLLQYQKGFSHANKEYNNAGSQYLNYQIVYRVEFPVKPKLKFLFQPMFVSPITTNESLHAPFNLKQFKAGIGFGFIYQLSRGKDVSGIHYKGEL